MSDLEAVGAVNDVEGKTSSSSINAYRQWLIDQGHIPLSLGIPQHPSELVSNLIDEAGNLTARWDKFSDVTKDSLSVSRMNELTANLHDGPGLANHNTIAPASESHPYSPGHQAADERGDEANSLQGAAEVASKMIREAGIREIEAQWMQTVRTVEQSMSMTMMNASIQSSISTSKQFQDGINSILRG